MYCDDTDADPRVDSLAARSFKVRSIVVEPISIDDSTVGVIEATSPRSNAFFPNHFLLLSQLSKLVTRVVTGRVQTEAEINRQIPAPPRLMQGDHAASTEVMKPSLIMVVLALVLIGIFLWHPWRSKMAGRLPQPVQPAPLIPSDLGLTSGSARQQRPLLNIAPKAEDYFAGDLGLNSARPQSPNIGNAASGAGTAIEQQSRKDQRQNLAARKQRSEGKKLTSKLGPQRRVPGQSFVKAGQMPKVASVRKGQKVKRSYFGCKMEFTFLTHHKQLFCGR